MDFFVLRKRLHIGSIRSRVLVGFMLMAFLPAIGVSAGSAIVSYYDGRQQAVDRLESVAALKELEIDVWVDALQNELLLAMNDEAASERVSVVLDVARAHQYYDWYNKAVRMRLVTLVEQSQQLEELCLLDLEGWVVLCTAPQWEATDCSRQPLFQQGLAGPYIALPFSDTRAMDGAFGEGVGFTSLCGTPRIAETTPVVIAARPVIGEAEKTLGVIVGWTRPDALARGFADRTGLGSTGRAYLITPEHDTYPTAGHIGAAELTIGEDESGDQHSLGIDAAIENGIGSSGVYASYGTQRVVGVYRWQPDLRAVLAVEQSLSEAFQAIFLNMAVSAGIALIAVLLAMGASFLLARSITNPLVQLVETASSIAAGHLERDAPVLGPDEIGTLATAFNSMTAQLRDSISNLEQHVQERTRDLEDANDALRRRALQLQTSAEVSRQITSILEIDDLLARVVALIRDSFEYTHTRVFLVKDEELVLRACTKGTRSTVERIPIGVTSLNSEAVKTDQTILVNEVSKDPRYLSDKTLPEIRSELVVPLRIGGRVIGTLDVLDAEENAFDTEDELLIQSLAGQVAIAIENARLYRDSRELAARGERDRLARDLHDSVIQSLYSLHLLTEGWRWMSNSGQELDIEGSFERAGQIAHQALKEMRLLVYKLQPAALEQEGLLGALHQRLGVVERRAGIRARVLAEELLELPPQAETNLFLVAQEALNNALKHSGATEVTVQLSVDGDQVQLQVVDNGQGFDPESAHAKSGLGLSNMRQRIGEMGGSLAIASAPGRGTVITARASCASQAHGMGHAPCRERSEWRLV
jgi:signal transduction histidine kinase